ncbi:hypothetical protein ColLi_11863 [Colletotrichum liriopes]|uniref:Uncharacterized protein n=1 Tax=Colletotrichum liriopes TaxID=708192 RepID=A0AA37GYG7_9PEZI|nr:hypothetical protein ColLi_11863 [Colletotrichum liriopes]
MSCSEAQHTAYIEAGIGRSRGGASSCRAPRQTQADDKHTFPGELRSSAGLAPGGLISGLSHACIATWPHTAHSGSATRTPRSAPRSAGLSCKFVPHAG